MSDYDHIFIKFLGLHLKDGWWVDVEDKPFMKWDRSYTHAYLFDKILPMSFGKLTWKIEPDSLNKKFVVIIYNDEGHIRFTNSTIYDAFVEALIHHCQYCMKG